MRLRIPNQQGPDLLDACSETARHWLSALAEDGAFDELVIITPEPPGRATSAADFGGVVAEVHHAWTRIQEGERHGTLDSWRCIHHVSEELAPGFGVYRLRGGQGRTLLCFLPADGPWRTADRLNALFFPLAAWCHLQKGRCLVHASGVRRDGAGFLFVGRSGAGKSTVAELSVTRGYAILHDDQVLVAPDLDGGYAVTDRAGLSHMVPLRAAFFLTQDRVDRLVPLSEVETARRLFDGVSEGNAARVMVGATVRRAFEVSAAVARRVPGYELHFRKSPDFWDLIEAIHAG